MFRALREFWHAGQRFLPGQDMPDDVIATLHPDQAIAAGNIEAVADVAPAPAPVPEPEPEPPPPDPVP